jgi:SAM-dependent methyltransferase
MTSYDTFGRWYDVAVGERPELAGIVHGLVQQFNPGAKTMLELGCGSGLLLKRFSKRYQVSGVDLSATMVDLARKRLPRADVQVGDITKLALGRTFDAVVCVFDTMNHLPEFSQWKQVFAAVSKHLAPGGIFIFDVNTKFKLERYRTEPPMAEFHDKGAVSIISVDREGRTHYEVSLRVFEQLKGGLYKHHQLKVRELVMPQERITEAAKRHFRQVVPIDPERSRPSALTEELFFVCGKPRS